MQVAEAEIRSMANMEKEVKTRGKAERGGACLDAGRGVLVRSRGRYPIQESE